MKRIYELALLSGDHQRGLVLAVQARRTAAQSKSDETRVREVWKEIETRFTEELEPHFSIEERYIAEPLRKKGESRLVEELLSEHRQLRAFFQEGAERNAEALARFGELLDRHIRFEEHEFFETAQDKLSPQELRRIRQACEEGRSREK